MKLNATQLKDTAVVFEEVEFKNMTTFDIEFKHVILLIENKDLKHYSSYENVAIYENAESDSSIVIVDCSYLSDL